MIFLGIDPGIHGALALWAPDARALRIEDMPTLKLRRGKRDRSEVDAIALASLMDGLAKHATLVVIEQAQIIPGTAGIMQTAQAWLNFGVVKGVAAAQMKPLELVNPAEWKRAMSCPKAKDGARHRASQLIPEHALNWRRVKDDGRAEAALLALYAERIHRQNTMGAAA